MSAKTKDLLDRMRQDLDNGSTESLSDAIATIERLTQPVEPFRWIRILESGTEIVCRRQISKAEAAHISEIGDELMPVYSAADLARLIAERDKYLVANDATLETLAQAVKAQIALQEQMKVLQRHLEAACVAIDNRNGDSEYFRESLAATEPKGEKE